MTEITGLRQVTFKFSDYAIDITEFELREAQEKELRHANNEEPIGHLVGAKEYEWSCSVEGEDAELFNQHSGMDQTFDAHLITPNGEWVLRDGTPDERAITSSEGESLSMELSGIAEGPLDPVEY